MLTSLCGSAADLCRVLMTGLFFYFNAMFSRHATFYFCTVNTVILKHENTRYKYSTQLELIIADRT